MMVLGVDWVIEEMEDAESVLTSFVIGAEVQAMGVVGFLAVAQIGVKLLAYNVLLHYKRECIFVYVLFHVLFIWRRDQLRNWAHECNGMHCSYICRCIDIRGPHNTTMCF